MNKQRCRVALALAAFLAAFLPVRAAAETPALIAIRNARVVPVSGPAMAKATVVIRDGLIESAGENAAVPAGAWVIEGDGLTVYPGLIDALSSIGITDPDALPAPPVPRRPGGGPPTPAVPATPQPPPAKGPEDRPFTSSWRRAADIINPIDSKIVALRSLGFTTAASFPMRGVFAGQGAVINLAGEHAGDMVVATPVGQYITTRGGGFGAFPGSLMGIFAYVRQVYLDAGHYQLARARYAQKPVGEKRPAYDRAVEGVLESPRMLLPANRRVEIERMIRFANELGQKAVLYGGSEGYRSADVLKAAGVPVLVSLKWPEKDKDADPEAYETLRALELHEKAPSTPGALANAGVPFALYSDGVTNSHDLKRAVKKALDAGLSEDALVRAFTLSPAEIYGLSDRLGSIEKGKIANLVVTKGNLFGDKTEVKFIFVDGKKFTPESEPEGPGGAVPGAGPAEEDYR
jgi:hypothetical protein